MTPRLSPVQMRDPEVMLETLRAAYQFAADTSAEMRGGVGHRLSDDEERELGRRLAFYWGEKSVLDNTGQPV